MTETTYFAIFMTALLTFSAFEILDALRQKTSVNWSRYPVHALLFIFHMVVISLLPLGAFTYAKLNSSHLGWGLFHWFEAPFIVEFVSCLTIVSFTYYILHLAMHHFPLFWRFHKIHHTDDYLDVTTVFRRHPFTDLVTFPFTLLPVLIFGFSPSTITANFAVILLLEMFQHSRFMLPKTIHHYLSWFLVTPQMHHLHHSSQPQQTNTNFGNDFAFWDHLFGTYLEWYDSEIKVQYGLDTVDPNKTHDLDHLLLIPFRK